MVKIKKGLSDADMLKGFSEELTFENGMYADEKDKQSKLKGAKAPAKKELLLPEDAQERLNRFLPITKERTEIASENIPRHTAPHGVCAADTHRVGRRTCVRTNQHRPGYHRGTQRHVLLRLRTGHPVFQPCHLPEALNEKNATRQSK